MIGSFSFNSILSESFGLVCKSVQRPLLPDRKEDTVDIDGASGLYDYGTDEYSIRNIVMQITYKETSFIDLRSKARQIAAWLSGGIWAPLIINDEPDKYYSAKITSKIDLDSFLESGSAEITFNCQPFAFSVDESKIITSVTSSPKVIEFQNPGTRRINFKSQPGSKFLITVTGTWTSISFALNSQTLNFTQAGSSATLVIDNIEMMAYLGSTRSFDKLTGDTDDFLRILPGTNTLTVSGTNINASVKIEFIPLWI